MVQYRLGVKVYAKDGTCPACKAPSDAYGDHALACAWEGERISRHNLLRDCLFQSASQAALAPAKEERSLIPGKNSRPADIYLPSWANGRGAALDVTVTSPLQSALLLKAASQAGSALSAAYDRKNRQSWEACNQAGIEFVALPVETLGGWHVNATKVLTKLGRQLARHTGREDGEVLNHLFQRLSVLLMRGNAALILSRALDFAPQHVDGDRDL